MSFFLLLQQIFIVFMMIGTGFAAQKTKVLNAHGSKVLSDVLMNIALPFTLLSSANLDSGRESVQEMLLSFGLLTAWYIVSALICVAISRRLHLSAGKHAVFVIHCVLPNSTFIGLPLVTALFGAKGIVYTAGSIMAYNLFFFTYGMALYRKGEPANWRTFVTPTNLATVVMLLLMITGVRLPQTFASFCGTMGAMTTPIALLIIGVMLGGSDLAALWSNRMLYGMSLLRCFVFPLLFALCLSFTPLDPQLCLGLVTLCACASGSLGAVVAKQTDTEPELASQIVTQSTLVLLLSMPLVVWLAQAILY